MPPEPESSPRTITDARALAAMANPARSRLVDLLSIDGPATASSLAERTGTAVGSISHHLKALAAVDLVEEVPELARDRRERWWRLVSPRIRWSRAEFADDAAAVTSALAAESLTLAQQFDRARSWLSDSVDGGAYEDAAFATQSWLRLNPDELTELAEELLEVLARWRERAASAPTDPTRDTVLIFARGFPARP